MYDFPPRPLPFALGDHQLERTWQHHRDRIYDLIAWLETPHVPAPYQRLADFLGCNLEEYREYLFVVLAGLAAEGRIYCVYFDWLIEGEWETELGYRVVTDATPALVRQGSHLDNFYEHTGIPVCLEEALEDGLIPIRLPRVLAAKQDPTDV